MCHVWDSNHFTHILMVKCNLNQTSRSLLNVKHIFTFSVWILRLPSIWRPLLRVWCLLATPWEEWWLEHCSLYPASTPIWSPSSLPRPLLTLLPCWLWTHTCWVRTHSWFWPRTGNYLFILLSSWFDTETLWNASHNCVTSERTSNMAVTAISNSSMP